MRLLLFVCWTAAALASALPAGNSLSAPAANSNREWQVVLVAGDRAQPVFDNATRAFGEWLVAQGVPAGNILRFSAANSEIGGDIRPSAKQYVLRHIAELPVQRGGRCLVFLTSHGERDAGIFLAPARETLAPDELAQALAQGCGQAPTIAIVSACFSGSFAAGAMAAPNRIILTAARADRASFGCEADRTYTFFDECLLGALPNANTWHAVFDATSACVGHREQQLGDAPSEPQAYFGTSARKMPLFFRRGAANPP